MYEVFRCSHIDCAQHGVCLFCNFGAHMCRLDDLMTVNCTTNSKCLNQQTIVNRETRCRYCWQTPESEHECETIHNCSVNDVRLFRTTCRVARHVVCMGRRNFYKNVR